MTAYLLISLAWFFALTAIYSEDITPDPDGISFAFACLLGSIAWPLTAFLALYSFALVGARYLFRRVAKDDTKASKKVTTHR